MLTEAQKAAQKRYREKSREKRAEYQKEYRQRTHEKRLEDHNQWRRDNPERWAYHCQKAKAKRRGIDWEFTFEEWLAWWGDDIRLRGRGAANLCMARRGDEGPYAPGNVVKATNADNGACCV